MVTYRQVGRGLVRTVRAIDREAKRAERARLAHEKAAQRQAMLDAAADAAEQHTQLVEALTSGHRIDFRRHDWSSVAARDRLPEPRRHGAHEDVARSALSTYRPSWVARTFRFEKRQRAGLESKIVTAKKRDDEDFEKRQVATDEHNREIAFAQSVVAKKREALERVLEEHTELSELPFSIEGLELIFLEQGRVVVMADGLDIEDMPQQSVSLLQSGKASIKPIPRGKIIELHRDNICSSAVRVGLECLQALPVDEIEVVMHTDLLNAATGHIASEPVLYLRLTVQAITAVNLQRTEASALVERLGAHLTWSKRDGFRRINLDPFGIGADELSDN